MKQEYDKLTDFIINRVIRKDKEIIIYNNLKSYVEFMDIYLDLLRYYFASGINCSRTLEKLNSVTANMLIVTGMIEDEVHIKDEICSFNYLYLVSKSMDEKKNEDIKTNYYEITKDIVEELKHNVDFYYPQRNKELLLKIIILGIGYEYYTLKNGAKAFS